MPYKKAKRKARWKEMINEIEDVAEIHVLRTQGRKRKMDTWI